MGETHPASNENTRLDGPRRARKFLINKGVAYGPQEWLFSDGDSDTLYPLVVLVSPLKSE